MPLDPKTPVLIGYGQVNHRDEIDPETRSVEPVDLMEAAARQAADARVFEAVDSIRVVNILSASVTTFDTSELTVTSSDSAALSPLVSMFSTARSPLDDSWSASFVPA